VTGLLPHLVQQVGDTGVGQVRGVGHLAGEAHLEDRFESDPRGKHRCHFFAAQRSALVDSQVKIQPGCAQQFVGHQLPVAQRSGQVDVGFDHPLEGGSIQSLNTFGCRSHGLSLPPFTQLGAHNKAGSPALGDHLLNPPLRI